MEMENYKQYINTFERKVKTYSLNGTVCNRIESRKLYSMNEWTLNNDFEWLFCVYILHVNFLTES